MALKALLPGLLALTACRVAAAPPVAYHRGATAFVDVTVIAMDQPGARAGQTVVVRDGRIAAVGPVAKVAVPKEGVRIEGRGRFLLPGLADMHVHLVDEAELEAFLSHGVTLVRNMNGRPRHLAWRSEIARGSRLGPVVVTAGPMIDGDPPYWPNAIVVRHAAEAAAVVEEQARAGYDFVKVYSMLEREAYDAIVAAARAQRLPVVGHVPYRVGLRHAIASGQASAEHLYEYADAAEADGSPHRGQWAWRRLVHAVAIDEAKLGLLAAELRRARVFTCPTAVLFRHWAPPAARAEWSDPALFRLGDDNRKALVRGLHASGAPIMLGTDTEPNVAGRLPGRAVLDELDFLVEAGLTGWEALATATRAPAEFLGQTAEFGTIALGRRADLVLVPGDPLADLTHLRRPLGVMVRGRWLPGIPTTD